MRSGRASHIAILLTFTVLTGCGERISQPELDSMAGALADVLVAVQHGADSAARVTIADSVARARGYSDWQELREEIGDAAIEPERLRSVLDSAQKSIEARNR
jgi:hypothetical protein